MPQPFQINFCMDEAPPVPPCAEEKEKLETHTAYNDIIFSSNKKAFVAQPKEQTSTVFELHNDDNDDDIFTKTNCIIITD